MSLSEQMELYDDMVYLAKRERRYKEQSRYSQCACIHSLEPSPKKCNASAQHLRWQGIYNCIDIRQKKFDQKIEDITYSNIIIYNIIISRYDNKIGT